MNKRRALALFAVLASACSSVDNGVNALKRACIPGVDCAAIDTIETPTNCSTCATCQDNWGSCNPGGFACKRGALDLDPNTPGCESPTTDGQVQWRTDASSDSISLFTFNGGQIQIPISVSALAYDEDDPSCIPTFTQSCAYTIRVLQLEIADFTITDGSWSGGVATLNGPVAASDDGTSVGVSAPMLFAFDVQQGSKRKIALNSPLSSIGITPFDSHRASLLIEVGAIDFGGYKITDLFLNCEVVSD